MIAQGPLYICTCCDQLWYKHGVVNANKLRECNPNISEYLCNKTQVLMALNEFVKHTRSIW